LPYRVFNHRLFRRNRAKRGSGILILPRQSSPDFAPIANEDADLFKINEQTNLVDLLAEIRKLVKEENFSRAENIASDALDQDFPDRSK
jgi:hypothetical protein